MRVYIGMKKVQSRTLLAEDAFTEGLIKTAKNLEEIQGYRLVDEYGYVTWTPASVFRSNYTEVAEQTETTSFTREALDMFSTLSKSLDRNNHRLHPSVVSDLLADAKLSDISYIDNKQGTVLCTIKLLGMKFTGATNYRDYVENENSIAISNARDKALDKLSKFLINLSYLIEIKDENNS